MKAIFVVGGGVFGLSTSIELKERGYEVTLFERGETVPASDGNSNDISRIVRMDYGQDENLTVLCKKAIERWTCWNQQALADGYSEKLFHQVGVLILSKSGFDQHQGYEKKSYDMVTSKKVQANVQRLKGDELSKSYPGWSRGDALNYIDGYINKDGGWANAGLAMNWMSQKAQKIGVKFMNGESGKVKTILYKNDQVIGVETMDGKKHMCENVIVAMGAWTRTLVPQVEGLVKAVGQPVVYFDVPPSLRPKFRAPSFPVYTADIARTGWYGFPVDNNGSLFKVGHHGNGFLVMKKISEKELCSVPDASVPLPEKVVDKVKEFVSKTFPDLANAKVAKARLCWYCDSWDGEFLIDYVPGVKGLMVACGDSGHGFKFAPVLGEVISDIFEKKPSALKEAFKWRKPTQGTKTEECRLMDGGAEVIYTETISKSKL